MFLQVDLGRFSSTDATGAEICKTVKRAMASIDLQCPTLTHYDDHTKLAADLGGGRALEISINAPSNFRARLMATLVPFVPTAMLIAGRERRPLNVVGPIDDASWLNLVACYWPLMKRLFDFDEITVTRCGNAGLPYCSHDDIALMFSAGIDSFYSLQVMRKLGTEPQWLVNINAGAHDADRTCWMRRLKVVAAVAAEVGAGLLTIDTNFHEHFSEPHVRSHLVRNLGAAYSLFPAVRRFVYSSAHAFEAISYEAAKTYGIDYLDHSVCSSITPAPISLSILGWDADRIRKTAAMAGEALPPRFLDVCTSQSYQATRGEAEPVNCGRCGKCIRTMLTLEHFGLLKDYGTQFPLEHFDRNRNSLVKLLEQEPHPMDQAVIALLRGQ